MRIEAEIIAVGDELACGERLDTNSQWLSQQLSNLGIQVNYHVTVADRLDLIEDAIKIAAGRSQLVFTTGGLGPTADDLTRQALASAADVELKLDHDSLEHIKALFKKNRRTMAPSNEIQAMFPVGAVPIPNRHGTAPGIDIRVERESTAARVFAMPGVPAEMKRMWKRYVAPAVKEDYPDLLPIFHFTLHCFGMGESEIESRLPDVVRRGREPQVGITASMATITLRITASAEDEKKFREQIRPTEQLIRAKLGNLIFGESDTTLEEVVANHLRASKQSIAVVDQGLGGLVAQKLHATKIQGILAGAWLCDDQQDLLELVTDAHVTLQSDWVLGVGPVVEESGEKKRRLIMHSSETQIDGSFDCNTHPDILNERSSKQALNFARLLLAKMEIG